MVMMGLFMASSEATERGALDEKLARTIGDSVKETVAAYIKDSVASASS